MMYMFRGSNIGIENIIDKRKNDAVLATKNCWLFLFTIIRLIHDICWDMENRQTIEELKDRDDISVKTLNECIDALSEDIKGKKYEYLLLTI